MSKSKKGLVQNVISVRISDEELADLKGLMGVTRKNVSALLRDALSLFEEKYRNGRIPVIADPVAFGDRQP